LEWSLVNRLAPADSINPQVEDWASENAGGPVRRMRLAKRVFNKAHFANLEQVLEYEARIQDIARRVEEFNEGLQAYMEKRQPNFLLRRCYLELPG
jgi:2-(1,2-epoxy-1,2-dihydrophenyl)acetyl-CoA isomerase